MRAMAEMASAEACFSTQPAIAAAARIAVRHHRQMSQFARHAEETVQHFAAGDDAASDAGAQRKQNQVVHVAARSHPLFSQRGGIGVVLQHDLSLEAPLHFVAKREVLQAGQIIRVTDHALLAAE